MESRLYKLSIRPPVLSKFGTQAAISTILVLATALYFYQLGFESFWVDELYSVNDALNIDDLSLVRPGYYFILHFWMQVSANDAWLRSLSIPFGIGSVFLIYQIGRRVSGDAVGVVAALMLTLSPLFINFVQMTRMYSMSTFLALAGTLALIYAVEKPDIPYYKAAWVCLRVLMAITAPLNSTLIVADAFILIFTFFRDRKLLTRFSLWFCLILIIWFPFLFSLISQTLGFLKSSLGLKSNSEPQAHGFPSPKLIVLRLRNFTASPFPTNSLLSSLFFRIYTFIASGIFALAVFQRNLNPKIIWIMVWIFTPTLLLLSISKSLWVDRYIIFLSPFVIILLAIGFIRLFKLKRSLALSVALIYFLAVGHGLFRYYSVQDRQDWRGLSAAIEQQEKAEDAVFITMGSTKMTTALKHYYKGAASIYRVPSICSSNHIKNNNLVLEDELLSMPPRFWLVCGETFDPVDFEEATGEQLRLLSQQKFTYDNFYRNDSWMYLLLVEQKGLSQSS